jgi:hypothetical protein
MYIKITKIDRDAEISGYDAIEVTGKKLDDGKSWSKPFFANNDDLVSALDDFGIGEEVNVVMEKKGKFWNIKDFKEMTPEDYEQVGGGGKKSSGGGAKKGTSKGGTSSSLTKEEWAEKDRKTAHRIAKSVALKAAVDNLKEGATVNAIIKRADELLAYLEGEEDAKEDPLDVDVD